LSFDFLLLAGFQIPIVLRFLAHPLYGIHHIRLLSQKSVTEISGPLNVIRQAIRNIGKGR
jgi:hypothetical protein